MHFKNRKPKPYKGCCWMCAKGTPRNRRELTLQERRLDPVPSPIEAAWPLVCGDEFICDWCLEPELATPDGPPFVIHREPSCRVPVLTRPLVFA